MKRIVALALVAVLMVACGATPKIKVNGETAKVGGWTLRAVPNHGRDDVLVQLEMDKGAHDGRELCGLSRRQSPRNENQAWRALF